MNREQYTESGYASKLARHRRGTSFLVRVRDLLGISKEHGKVHSCKGGPAVAGEVTLHTETFYVSIEVGGISFARKCKGMKDYSGERNIEIPKAALLTPEALASWLKRAGLA